MPAPSSPVEIVVVAQNSEAPIGHADLTASRSAETRIIELASPGATVTRSFGPANRLGDRVRGTSLESSGSALLNYFSITGFEGNADEIAAALAADDAVASAFVKPPAEPPIAPPVEGAVAERAPGTGDAPPSTPDFTGSQGYLDAAPNGVDARWAWTRPGGRGAGIQIVDVEGAWRFTHEDLLQNQGGVISGPESADIGWRNHGTAVIGEFSGDDNGLGITGIAPDANVRAVSIFGSGGSAAAIRTAADALGAGDVILIELHRPGPRFNFAGRSDQLGYIAVEWWPDDFAAIQYAIGRGVIVVEAGGNGAENLDDGLYDTPAAGFPGSWANPFRGGTADSGAIIVGAGAPPSGNFGSPRSRLDFSNYGSRIDAQGWGREVVTTGYGDLQGGPNEDLWYTQQFSGTSSASPIVVGAVAAYQGINAAGSGRKTPSDVRNRLRTTGSGQTDGPNGPASQRIGSLPDLRALAGVIKVKDIKDAKAEKLEKVEIKEGKELKQEK
uniref:S8 family peptidase n=1 Tax=Sinomonas notoginsengisoli TaxID=1457311 RepID=UPI001F346797